MAAPSPSSSASTSFARAITGAGSPASRPTSMPYERSAPPGMQPVQEEHLVADLAHRDVIVAHR